MFVFPLLLDFIYEKSFLLWVSSLKISFMYLLCSFLHSLCVCFFRSRYFCFTLSELQFFILRYHFFVLLIGPKSVNFSVDPWFVPVSRCYFCRNIVLYYCGKINFYAFPQVFNIIIYCVFFLE